MTEPERRVELGKDVPPWAEVPAPIPLLPPYPPPPPGPVYPIAGPPPYGVPPIPGHPVPRPLHYGYADNTEIWSILSFCCVPASVLGGALLCGIPVLITAPAGIVLGAIGHAKGEKLGRWAAITNGVIALFALLLLLFFLVVIGTF